MSDLFAAAWFCYKVVIFAAQAWQAWWQQHIRIFIFIHRSWRPSWNTGPMGPAQGFCGTKEFWLFQVPRLSGDLDFGPRIQTLQTGLQDLWNLLSADVHVGQCRAAEEESWRSARLGPRQGEAPSIWPMWSLQAWCLQATSNMVLI